jgi:Ni,Fe-hydrogenase III component G
MTMDLSNELRDRFPDLIAGVETSQRQISVRLSGPDIRPIADHLRSTYQSRLAAVFAEDRIAAEGVFYNHYVFEQPGQSVYLIVQAPISPDHPQFPSLSAALPAVNWQEREIQDWFGLEAAGHPNPRRVALHDNWPDVHPLRKDFPLRQVLPPFEGERHVYRPTLGEGVFQVPVGPVHAGIIEPGHFNFAVAGEPILYLQLRMFYTHKGTEKLFEDLPIHRAVFLAESISGDSAFSHGTAFCQAIENAGEIEVPLAGRVMRTILLELERIYNHIADIGAIAMDVGFMVANAHGGRLRELVLRLNEALTGSRLLRAMVCVGGVRRSWSPAQCDLLRRSLKRIELFSRPTPRATAWTVPAFSGLRQPSPSALSEWAAVPPVSTWTSAATTPTPLTIAIHFVYPSMRRVMSCIGCRFGSTR